MCLYPSSPDFHINGQDNFPPLKQRKSVVEGKEIELAWFTADICLNDSCCSLNLSSNNDFICRIDERVAYDIEEPINHHHANEDISVEGPDVDGRGLQQLVSSPHEERSRRFTFKSMHVAITSQYAAIIRMLSDPGLKSTIIAHCANLASRLTVRVLTMIDITFLVVWKSSEIDQTELEVRSHPVSPCRGNSHNMLSTWASDVDRDCIDEIQPTDPSLSRCNYQYDKEKRSAVVGPVQVQVYSKRATMLCWAFAGGCAKSGTMHYTTLSTVDRGGGGCGGYGGDSDLVRIWATTVRYSTAQHSSIAG
ncbi:hypothetical protein CIB48_g1056 [Xylaria polymorpha]|nr:hypothetical protein CIB48_g1056 [Xylaria polymorpha]